MSITLQRLDIPDVITAMIAVTSRRAIDADGQRQQALDEIAQSLNNVAAIIDRHKLAEDLTGAIPPVPARWPNAESEEADEEAEEDEQEDEPAEEVPPPLPQALTPEPLPSTPRRRANTTDRVLGVLAKSQDGETVNDLVAVTGDGLQGVRKALQNLQREGQVTKDNKRPATYRLTGVSDG